MPPTTATRYYGTASVATKVKRSRASVSRDIADGTLHAHDFRRPGSSRPRWRVAEADLAAYEERIAALREPTDLDKTVAS